MKRNKATYVFGIVLALVLVASLALAACTKVEEPAAPAPTTLSPELEKLRLAMDIPTGEAAGAGLKIPIGVSLPMSGGAEHFAKVMSDGANLGIKQIKEMGGPEFIPTYYDIQMGVAERGIDAVNDMGSRGLGLALVGWSFCAGVQCAGAQKYEILMLDPGGGTGPNWKGEDYCWGTRMIDNEDQVGVALTYCARAHPEWKTAMSIGEDYGKEHSDALMKNFQTTVDTVNRNEGTDIQYLGDERVPIGTDDFSSLIAKINAKDPDIVLMMPLNGPSPILFMKQVTGAHPIKAQVMGSDWSVAQAETAGDAWRDYWYASQMIFPKYDVNPLAQYFFNRFREENEYEPDFYCAGFYEDALTLWDLVRRVIAKGGDPTSGKELQDALKEDPSFYSIYNGDENTVGRVHWNPEEHSPTDIPIYLSKMDLETHWIIPLAVAGDEGVNFRMIEE